LIPNTPNTNRESPVCWSSEPSPLLYSLVDDANDLAAAARSPATRRAYDRCVRSYLKFAGAERLPALSEHSSVTVALFVAHLVKKGLAISTVEQHLAAVAAAHRDMDLRSPTEHPKVRTIMSGARRTYAGRPPTRKSRALSYHELLDMAESHDDPRSMRCARDKAILLTGFIGGLRASELVALDWADTRSHRQGLILHIRRSKTDQEGAGRDAILPRSRREVVCPVRALEAWAGQCATVPGACFTRIRRGDSPTRQRLSPQSVSLILRSMASHCAVDPTDLSAHSLRSGFVTQAAECGASERAIANQTGHRSTRVLRSYIQRATLFDDNAATALGL